MPMQLSQPDLIRQDELRRVVALDLEIARLQRTRDQLAEEIYRKRKAGAMVEPGTHVCEIEVTREGGVLVEQLKIR
ncbi:MAG: hypothetical protein ACM3S5_18825 [Rhodospirillales bacterium]